MTIHRFILGTAGHIDHGKSSLVQALTGTDPDRLKEEKARGITIELGFASLRQEETEVGLVDVPGHERFIRAMAAGAAGVDAVMLVVAADEGVMPQTREHLAVCSLLGVTAGFVALNKVDLVQDPDWLDLVESDLTDTLAGTFLQGCPIVRCSAATGQGVDAVRQAIFDLTKQVPGRQVDGLLRLPMDRVFTMPGHGTVVTGTLVSGSIRVGDTVLAAPGELQGSVRGIQVHGHAVEQAVAGQRTAVNLRGVDHHDLERGQVLVRQGEITPTQRFDARLHLLDWVERPIRRRHTYIVLHGTSQAQGAIFPLQDDVVEPGTEAWVQVQLDRPLMMLPGDRFVLQGFTLSRDHGSTIGGGVVVRAHSSRRRRRDSVYVEMLESLLHAEPAVRVATEISLAGQAGLAEARLFERVPLSPATTRQALEALVAHRQVVRGAHVVVHADPFARICNQIEQVVTELQTAQPMAEQFGRSEVRSRLGWPVDPEIFDQAVARLVAEGKLEASGEGLAPPGSAERQARKALGDKVVARLEAAGLAPPKPAALAEEFGVAERDLRDLLASLVKAGRLARAKDDLFFGQRAVDALQQRLVAFLQKHGQITPQQFKEMCGVTRKHLIPLSEWFDAQKVTLRVGEVRKLRQ